MPKYFLRHTSTIAKASTDSTKPCGPTATHASDSITIWTASAGAGDLVFRGGSWPFSFKGLRVPIRVVSELTCIFSIHAIK